VQAGVPERVVMTITGRRTRAVFDRYHIVSPGDLREAARKLAAATAARSHKIATKSARAVDRSDVTT
jgi:hypothetical protein